MKLFLLVILSLGLSACSGNPDTAPRIKLTQKDSNIVKKEPANPYVNVDVSPMDMSYLPVDYPKMSVRRPQPVARVIYCRPHKQGRTIFGSLIKYGEPWRLGANEATELELFQPVTIQNRTVPKGRYVLYCIPNENSWTIVFNDNLFSWGLNLDPSKDKYRFEVPATKKVQDVEYFSMIFQHTETGADLIMAWDVVEVRLPIQYTEK